MVVELARDYFIASLDHCIGNLRLKTVVKVGLSSTLFEKTESFNDRERHAFTLTSNLEVLERSLSLSTPVAIGRDLNGTEGIGFLSELLRRGKEANKLCIKSRKSIYLTSFACQIAHSLHIALFAEYPRILIYIFSMTTLFVK